MLLILGLLRINFKKFLFFEFYFYIDNFLFVIIICYWWGYLVFVFSIKKNNKVLLIDDVKINGLRFEVIIKIDSEDDFGNYVCYVFNMFGDVIYDLGVLKVGKWYCLVGWES